MRNVVYRDINTLKACPFLQTIGEQNQWRLEDDEKVRSHRTS
jgi:hypothetical protein